MRFSDSEVNYIIWQNRFLDFYIAARTCYGRKLYAPAAFLAQQGIEQLLKATLIYWDRTFEPESHGHALAKMARMVSNKVPGQHRFFVPEYFYLEQRYQSVSRYPKGGKGIGIPECFQQDLDVLVADLIEMVPFQFNSQLYHTLTGKNWDKLVELRRSNQSVQRMRQHVGAKLMYKGRGRKIRVGE